MKEKSGLKFEVGAMGTTIEGTLDEVFEVVKNAHRAVLAAGAGRLTAHRALVGGARPLQGRGADPRAGP
jgi:uncharacterized protein YqgV (UPF0045/DUF77 family)